MLPSSFRRRRGTFAESGRLFHEETNFPGKKINQLSRTCSTRRFPGMRLGNSSVPPWKMRDFAFSYASRITPGGSGDGGKAFLLPSRVSLARLESFRTRSLLPPGFSSQVSKSNRDIGGVVVGGGKIIPEEGAAATLRASFAGGNFPPGHVCAGIELFQSDSQFAFHAKLLLIFRLIFSRTSALENLFSAGILTSVFAKEEKWRSVRIP